MLSRNAAAGWGVLLPADRGLAVETRRSGAHLFKLRGRESRNRRERVVECVFWDSVLEEVVWDFLSPSGLGLHWTVARVLVHSGGKG